MDWLALTIALVIMLIGLAGTVIPLLPGAPLIILAMVVYGFMTGFEIFPWTFWVGQGMLLVLIFAVDYIAGVIGVKRYGGSKAAVWGSIAGAFIGLFTLGPIGIIVGPFLGAVVGELISQRPPEQAVKAGIGTLLGLAGGAVFKIIIEIGMIAWFLILVL